MAIIWQTVKGNILVEEEMSFNAKIIGDHFMPWKFTEGKLWSPQGRSWPAVSGPWGKGHLPDGPYTIERPVLTDEKPMKDVNGFGWKARLVPNFKTERFGLLIHPDGNVPGTLGCIGICKPTDTTSLYDDLMNNSDRSLVVDCGNR
jgi:hypothetical protein